MQLHFDGFSTTCIAEVASISDRQVRRILTKLGVDLRGRRKPPKYRINAVFFKTWSANMAYVLGLVVTDGNVTGNTLVIAQKDPYILERVVAVLQTDYPIKKRSNNGGRTQIHTLNISRKEIVDDLHRLGVTEKKSLTVKFPEVPHALLPHFVRGVIDGDGWVHERGYVMNITSGSIEFAEGLRKTFEELALNTRLTKDGNVYRIWVSGKDDISRLSRWLYNDSGDLFLPRKRARFEVNAA